MISATRVLEALREMPPDQLVEPGVTAGDALALMTVPPAPAGTRYVPDQAYGEHGQTMHLYARADATERAPGVVFIHGGGFQEGFAEMMIGYAAALAERGMVTASIEYRLSGEASWPAQLEDCTAALQWVRENASRIGLDADRLAVSGGSAGGHLAAMLASTQDVRAAVIWYPGIDLRPSRGTAVLNELVEKLFGRAVDDEEALAASPVGHVQTAAPTLTFTGTDDPIIPVAQVRDYHRALDAAGVDNELVEVDGVGHSFDYSRARWQECLDLMVPWLEERLSATPTSSSSAAATASASSGR